MNSSLLPPSKYVETASLAFCPVNNIKRKALCYTVRYTDEIDLISLLKGKIVYT